MSLSLCRYVDLLRVDLRLINHRPRVNGETDVQATKSPLI